MLTCVFTPSAITPRFIQGVAVVLLSLPLYNDRIVTRVLDLFRPEGSKAADK